MGRRWSGCRRVADMRCGMRVTPAPTPAAPTCVLPLRVLRLWLSIEVERSSRTRSYTRSVRMVPWRGIAARAPGRGGVFFLVRFGEGGDDEHRTKKQSPCSFFLFVFFW